jgi:hypothetical protein
LVDQDSEEKQMQDGRRRGELWVSAGWCDGFADSLDAGFSGLGSGAAGLKQDSSVAIRDVV